MKKLLQLTHSIVNFILNQLTYLPDFRVTSWNNRGATIPLDTETPCNSRYYI